MIWILIASSIDWTQFWGLLLAALGIVVAIFIFLYQNRIFRRAKVKKYYSVVWKKANRLTPRQVMHLRGSENTGFNPYYYHREEFNRAIQESIRNNQNVFVIGNPLAGKTRMVYQNLKNLNNAEVIIPLDVMISMEDFLIPRSFTPWRKKILLLDDLNKYIDNPNFTHLLQEFADKDILIIATCRSGPELKSVENKLEQYISSLFKNRLEIPEIDRGLAEKVAREVKTRLPETFDGNIGSIFLPLDTMIDRFKASPEQQKCIMRSIKRLYLAGITEEREAFLLENVKKVCVEKEGIDFREFEWSKHLGELKTNSLIAYESDSIEVEETYLDNVIDTEFDTLANLRQMYDIFQHEPDALFKIGNSASGIGEVDLRKADFNKLAIKAYLKTINYWTNDNNPESYAVTRNNLGNAYRTLAEVEDQVDNCKRAIESYQEALKVKTVERFPIQYAMTQNNLGAAYSTLAVVEDKVNNCKLAIESYQEALKVRTFERFPIQYAMTRNNLGNAYRTLAEVEDQVNNCKRAIESYQEALKVRTVECFPMDYAMTQNNLGDNYRILAEVERKADNCKLAIKACKEALKVYTFERFPIQYAATRNNLGNAYGMLAEVEDKVINCKRAIESYREAFKVHTFDHFPIQYADTRNNLGNAYGILAEVEDKITNYKLAIESYREALEVHTVDRFPMDYAITQNILGVAYSILAVDEDKAINCILAIESFQKALKVYTIERFPMDYAMTLYNLGFVFIILAEDGNKESNCREARKCFDESLVCYKKLNFANDVKNVEKALQMLDNICEGGQAG